MQSLLAHRAVEQLKTSLYGLVIVCPFVKLVQRVLRGGGGGGCDSVEVEGVGVGEGVIV